MRVYTHGSKRGQIELLVSERRLLDKAHSLLCDIEAHGNAAVMEVAAKASNSLTEVIELLTGKEEVEV